MKRIAFWRPASCLSMVCGVLVSLAACGAEEHGDASASPRGGTKAAASHHEDVPSVHVRLEARVAKSWLQQYRLFQEECWSHRGKSEAEIEALSKPLDDKISNAFVWARRDGFYTADYASIETTTQILIGDFDDPECLPKLVRTYGVDLESWCGPDGSATTVAKAVREELALPMTPLTTVQKSERDDEACQPKPSTVSGELPISNVDGVPCIWSSDGIAAALASITGGASAAEGAGDARARSDTCVWAKHYGKYPAGVNIAMPNMLGSGWASSDEAPVFKLVRLNEGVSLGRPFFTVERARERVVGPVVVPVTLETASMNDRK